MEYPTLPAQQRRRSSTARTAFAAFLPRLQAAGGGAEVDVAARRAWIRALLQDLEEGAADVWDQTTTLNALSILKLLGRSSVGSDDIIEHFSTLLRLAGYLPPATPPRPHTSRSPSPSPSSPPLPPRPPPPFAACTVSLEAARVIANALVLHPLARASAQLSPALPLLVDRALRTSPSPGQDPDAAFLPSRILFALTASPSPVVVELVEKTPIAAELAKALSAVAARRGPQPSGGGRDRDAGAAGNEGDQRLLQEWSKLVFNVMLQYPRSVVDAGRPAPPPIGSPLSSSPSAPSSPSLAHPQKRRANSGLTTSSPGLCRTQSTSVSDRGKAKMKSFVEAVGNKMSRTRVSGARSSGSRGSSNSSDPGRASSSSEEDSIAELDGPRFEPLLSPLVDLYLSEPLPNPINFQPPISYYVQAMLNFPATLPAFLRPYPSYSPPHPPPPPSTAALPPVLAKTFDILDQLLETYFPGSPDDLGSRRAAASAPGGPFLLDEGGVQLTALLADLVAPHGLPEDARRAAKERVVPSDVDRSKGLDKQDTLVGRLLRIMGGISHEAMKTAAGSFLMSLYDNDASKLVAAVGYGPVAGYLTTIGSTIVEPDPATMREDLNPITGAHWSAPDPDAPIMSDEEKEREAERLGDLFDRMNRTGVVKIGDPRAEAARAGAFERGREEAERKMAEEEAAEERQGLEELRQYKERKGKAAQSADKPS